MDPALDLMLDSPEATAAFAARLAPTLGAGDVLLLEGEIGAGKSHFARALITARLAAVGLAEDIPSPTYTLVQTYVAGPLAIWHCDLYRLTGSDEAVELGLTDAFDTALCLIEWPDRLGPEAPTTAARLCFGPGQEPDQRHLSIMVAQGSLRDRLSATLGAVSLPGAAPASPPSEAMAR